MEQLTNGEEAWIQVQVQLTARLQEALDCEAKFRPHLQLPAAGGARGSSPEAPVVPEVTLGIRDGSAHVLRCLKMWYELPSDVLFIAINLMDRFLTKMKVRPKHMACISVSAFHLAARMVANHDSGETVVPEPQDLVSISQCKCTLGDLNRMENIIENKLGTEPGTLPATALDFLRLFHELFRAAATKLGLQDLFARLAPWDELIQYLEFLLCDSHCANRRPSELALALLCEQLDSRVAHLQASETPMNLTQLVKFASDLQKMCKFTDKSFFSCAQIVGSVILRYNDQRQMPHRQRLVWRLSQRTLRLLRPTDRLTSTLPTIVEQVSPIPATSVRERTPSSSSDDSWPEYEKENDSDSPLLMKWSNVVSSPNKQQHGDMEPPV